MKQRFKKKHEGQGCNEANIIAERQALTPDTKLQVERTFAIISLKKFPVRCLAHSLFRSSSTLVTHLPLFLTQVLAEYTVTFTTTVVEAILIGALQLLKHPYHKVNVLHASFKDPRSCAKLP